MRRQRILDTITRKGEYSAQYRTDGKYGEKKEFYRIQEESIVVAKEMESEGILRKIEHDVVEPYVFRVTWELVSDDEGMAGWIIYEDEEGNWY